MLLTKKSVIGEFDRAISTIYAHKHFTCNKFHGKAVFFLEDLQATDVLYVENLRLHSKVLPTIFF